MSKSGFLSPREQLHILQINSEMESKVGMTVDGSEFYVGRMKALNNQSQGRESSFGLNFPSDDY